jgi:hypothetical protein
MATEAQKMETPLIHKPAASEPLIFTMPEAYRGLAASQKPPVPAKSSPPAVVLPVQAPTPAASSKPAGASLSSKKISASTKAILAAGIVFLLGLAGVGTYVYLSLSPPLSSPETKPLSTVPPVEQETPEPSTEEPPSPVPETEAPASPFPSELSPGRDTDSDGLSDLEELLYGTQTRLPDTDADGFLDGNEVFHRYNPRGAAGATLFESGIVSQYAPGSIFRVLYPTPWSARPAAPGVVIVAPSGETFTLTFETKDSLQSLLDWYVEANPEGSVSELSSSTTKRGYPALVTVDQMTVFVDLGSSVATVSYHVAVKSTIDFLQTFQMVVNSLEAEGP